MESKREITQEARKNLKANLKRVGLLGGIVWNEVTGNLVSGHQRISVIDEVNKYNPDTRTNDYLIRVEVVHMDEKTEKEQNIFMNNRSVQGDFDSDMLKDMLDGIDYSLAGLNDFDLNMLGIGDLDFSINDDIWRKEDILDDSLSAIDEATKEGKENKDINRSNNFYEDSKENQIVRHNEVQKIKDRISNQNSFEKDNGMLSYVVLSFNSPTERANFMKMFGYGFEEETPAVPEPNYTTTEAEKGVEPEEANQETTLPPVVEEKAPEVKDAIADDVQIMETEVKETEIKRPEIIPGEEILPDVDIPLVISNLTNADYDVQAQQMEEIARISLDNPENAVPYIVREVFSSLIDITKKDTANLAAPTDEQVQARKKLISNFIVMENAKQGQGQVKLPYQLTEKDFALANELSPMEQAERNKEYALYTISILAKIYTDEVEKQTGNIVPLTDLPGSAAIVDALRFNPNSGVKIAAIDALRHIQRPEYKEELTTLYTLAQADSNPQVSMAAERALNRSNV